MFKLEIRPAGFVRRFLTGFSHAGRGIGIAICTQPNMRVHVLLAIAVVVLSLFLNLPALHFALIILTIAIVLAAELLNTAVEAVVDIVSPEFHPLAGIAKDTAAGAVLVCAIGALAVGGVILIPHILSLIGQ